MGTRERSKQSADVKPWIEDIRRLDQEVSKLRSQVDGLLRPADGILATYPDILNTLARMGFNIDQATAVALARTDGLPMYVDDVGRPWASYLAIRKWVTDRELRLCRQAEVPEAPKPCPLDPTDEHILKFLRNNTHKAWLGREIAAETRLKHTSIRKNLARLARDGVIQGSTRRGYRWIPREVPPEHRS
jgi:hypothetical protein